MKYLLCPKPKGALPSQKLKSDIIRNYKYSLSQKQYPFSLILTNQKYCILPIPKISFSIDFTWIQTTRSHSQRNLASNLHWTVIKFSQPQKERETHMDQHKLKLPQDPRDTKDRVELPGAKKKKDEYGTVGKPPNARAFYAYAKWNAHARLLSESCLWKQAEWSQDWDL